MDTKLRNSSACLRMIWYRSWWSWELNGPTTLVVLNMEPCVCRNPIVLDMHKRSMNDHRAWWERALLAVVWLEDCDCQCPPIPACGQGSSGQTQKTFSIFQGIFHKNGSNVFWTQPMYCVLSFHHQSFGQLSRVCAGSWAATTYLRTGLRFRWTAGGFLKMEDPKSPWLFQREMV